jgi:uncharacterized protein (TIGR04255 family)
MPFPESRRVSYAKNPLDKVICQLRFPPILKIDSEPPAAFQDVIRKDYPMYGENVTIQQGINIGMNPQNQQEIIKRLINPPAIKNHEFRSPDNGFQINLTRTFLSLSTNKYISWEDFSKRFKEIYDAFIKLYSPPFFIRIGLRYIDIIDRAALKLNNTDWKELIKPHFLGLLAEIDDTCVTNFNNNYVISLTDKESFLNLSTSFVYKAATSEKCFMISSDFNTPKRIEYSNVFEKLDFLHVRATRLIRWGITDKLHNAMGPSFI